MKLEIAHLVTVAPEVVLGPDVLEGVLDLLLKGGAVRDVLPVLGPEPVGVDAGEDDGGDHDAAVFVSNFVLRSCVGVCSSQHVLDRKLAPGACGNSMVSGLHLIARLLPVFLSPLFGSRIFLDSFLMRASTPLSSVRIPMPPLLRPIDPLPTSITLPPLSQIPLTRSVSSMLLDSGPLAVESVVGGTLEALRANARGPAAGSSVAESGERGRGARGGTEAEHGVVCVVVEWRVVGGLVACSLSLEVALRFEHWAGPTGAELPEASNLMTSFASL